MLKNLRSLLGGSHHFPQLLLVLTNTAIPPCNGAVLADPDLLGDLVDETEVVRHKNHRAVEIVNSLGKRVNALHIQVVGGLIKQEHVGVALGDEREHDTALETVREGADRLSLGLAGNTVATQPAAPLVSVEVLSSKLLLHGVQRAEGVIELLSRVLVVTGELEVRVDADHALGGSELANHQLEESRLASTVGTDKGNAGVHVDTELKVSVKVLLLLAAVGERDVVEDNDGGGERTALGEEELQLLVLHNFLDKTGSLHLVNDLLAGLSLAHEVRVGTAGGDELLHVLDLLLLLLVLLHLLHLQLLTGLLVLVVVTGPVGELLETEDHHVRAHAVKEILGVGHDNENAGVGLKVVLEPHTGFKIKMVGGLIKKEEGRADEKSTGKSHTHTPTTRQVLGELQLLLVGETQTSENIRSSCLKSVGVEELKTLVHIMQSLAVGTLFFEESLLLLLESSDFTLNDVNDSLKGSSVAGRHLSTKEVHIDVVRNRHLSVSEHLEEGGLTRAVSTEETITTAIVKFDNGVGNELFSEVRQRETLDLDISGGRARCEHTSAVSLRHLQLILHLLSILNSLGLRCGSLGGLSCLPLILSTDTHVELKSTGAC
eukprot:Colp12_sorted_trinity150504_noHs@26975